jgi:tripartite-type tricarboxylate transporter receptor subunit TctC
MSPILLKALVKHVALLTLAALAVASPAIAWQPSGPVTIVVPAGPGGGADQMARLIAAIAERHRLVSQPVKIVNRGERDGAEGFLEVKAAFGDPLKLIVTLSNVFTTPLGSGVAFAWKDLTPVAMLALDQFALWVPADAPWRTAADYIAAVRAAPDGTFRMAGTGSRQEDELITAALHRYTAPRFFRYMPEKGGGKVAERLAAKAVDSTVNNPIEAAAAWQAGSVRPLCLFAARRSAITTRVTQSAAWSDLPTCREAGIDIQYEMLRGIFMPPGVAGDAVTFYTELLRKVTATPEWAEFMQKGAFNPAFMTGADLVVWLQAADDLHYSLMRTAGFLAPGKFRFITQAPRK